MSLPLTGHSYSQTYNGSPVLKPWSSTLAPNHPGTFQNPDAQAHSSEVHVIGLGWGPGTCTAGLGSQLREWASWASGQLSQLGANPVPCLSLYPLVPAKPAPSQSPPAGTILTSVPPHLVLCVSTQVHPALTTWLN